jgi:hypothetical protein
VLLNYLKIITCPKYIRKLKKLCYKQISCLLNVAIKSHKVGQYEL